LRIGQWLITSFINSLFAERENMHFSKACRCKCRHPVFESPSLSLCICDIFGEDIDANSLALPIIPCRWIKNHLLRRLVGPISVYTRKISRLIDKLAPLFLVSALTFQLAAKSHLEPIPIVPNLFPVQCSRPCSSGAR
jgi:hypothetical protein